MKRDTPFAQWLYEARTARGLTMVALADRAGISHARIAQLEKGDSTTVDMVQRLSKALMPEGADDHTTRALLNAGMKAAFPRPQDTNEEVGGTLEPLSPEQKLKLWESMGARTYYGPEPDEGDFELSENPDEWPPELREALQEALFYTRLIPAEFVKTVFQLWRDQARAHAGVAVNNKVMEAAMKDGKAKKN